jgi:hypothetical protein
MTDEELAGIEARVDAATKVGLDQRGPWASVAYVPVLLAEVKRLRGLVEAAYREGFYDGGIAAMFPHKVREWQYSDARRALDGAP